MKLNYFVMKLTSTIQNRTRRHGSLTGCLSAVEQISHSSGCAEGGLGSFFTWEESENDLTGMIDC